MNKSISLNAVVTKFCPVCKEKKLSSEFYKDSSHSHGLSSRCKPCNRTRLKNRRSTHRELVYGQVADWRARNKEHTSQYMADYHSKNKSTRNLKIRIRKKKLDLIDELLPGEWETMVEQCNNVCIVPGCSVSPVTMDHVTPISKGGRHHISNLQPLCQHHNDSKGVNTTDYRNVD